MQGGSENKRRKLKEESIIGSKKRGERGIEKKRIRAMDRELNRMTKRGR